MGLTNAQQPTSGKGQYRFLDGNGRFRGTDASLTSFVTWTALTRVPEPSTFGVVSTILLAAWIARKRTSVVK
jgi:hypothetical protein